MSESEMIEDSAANSNTDHLSDVNVDSESNGEAYDNGIPASLTKHGDDGDDIESVNPKEPKKSKVQEDQPEKASNKPAKNSRLTQFALNLVDYTHDSWYAQWQSGELMLKIKSHNRAKEFVSIEIMKNLGLAPEVPAELVTSNISSLALSDSQQLQSLVWRFGLICMGGEFKNIVDGNQIRSIVKVIGTDSFRLALKNAGRLVTKNGDEYAIASNESSKHSTSLEQIVILNGLNVLATLCADTTREIYCRMLLKLPNSWANQYSPDTNQKFDKSVFVLLAELQEMENSSTPDTDYQENIS